MALNVDSIRVYGAAAEPIQIDPETSLFLQRENKLERSPKVDVFQYSNPIRYRKDDISGKIAETSFDLERKCALDAPVVYIGTVADKEAMFSCRESNSFFKPDAIKGMVEELPLNLEIKRNWGKTSTVKGICGEDKVDVKIQELSRGTYLIKGDDFEYKISDSMLQRPVIIPDESENKVLFPVLFAYLKEKFDSQKDDIIISRRAKLSRQNTRY